MQGVPVEGIFIAEQDSEAWPHEPWIKSHRIKTSVLSSDGKVKLDITFDGSTSRLMHKSSCCYQREFAEQLLPSECGTSGQEGTEHPGDWFQDSSTIPSV